MTDTSDRVRRYYAPEPAKEWRRLESLDTGTVEFELTRRHISGYLAPASRVLDIGGGPGRYAVWLAESGHLVTLADLVPELLELARDRIATHPLGANVEEIVVADVCDLSRWPDTSFDAVLCLGPFYHLPEAERRELAASELLRVLRPGGVLFAAFTPRLGFLRRTIALRDEWHHLLDREFLRALLENGTFVNDNPRRFDAGYGARPQEIEPFFEGHGFETISLLAAEGFAPAVYAELAEMAADDPVAYAASLDLLQSTAADPSILGAANHLLYIGRKSVTKS